MSITLNSIQPTLHELKLGLKELYGDRLVKLILFGSHARGEANPDSDIDLLAVLKSPVSQVQEISYWHISRSRKNLRTSKGFCG
ncbi:nucleotidyltransferase domain-containing protein [Pseudanabaena sp. UWO310]|uniref:nucleotidyltransferase domain-containing protein n=1 Tax=Pseudanabaena sp. UWO310 TaxID=2480795 RepID=UPI0021E0FBD9|nr:nucleotidyltransferase domain-containing protein [Pseudanabaena sp. UWO310]